MTVFRRGVARTAPELDGQVARWRELGEDEAALEAERQVLLGQLRVVEKRRDAVRSKKTTIWRNISRFYNDKGDKYFSPGTATIKLPSGKVWSRPTQELKFKSERVVVHKIILMGLWWRFLRIELNRTALKNSPRLAAKFGVKVVEGRVVIITPAK